MRILHGIAALSGGGAERQLSVLAPALARRGLDVHVAYVHLGPAPSLLDEPGVIGHRLGGRSNYDPKLIVDLMRVVRQIRPTMMQTWITQMDVIGGCVCLAARVPWILREPSSQFPDNGWRQQARQVLARTARAIVANSPQGRAAWQAVKGCPPVYLIPNGIQLEDIERASNMALRPKPPDARPVVLYAGRLHQVKNIRLLLEVFCQAATRSGADFLLCGDGEERQWAEAFVKRRGLEARIRFRGHCESVWATMRQADLVVSLSSREGCPNTVLEAMAVGCPLLLSDIPGHRAVVDERAACYVPLGDADLISASLLSMLNNPKRLHDMAVEARKQAGRFHVDRMVDAYIKMYEDLLIGSARP